MVTTIQEIISEAQKNIPNLNQERVLEAYHFAEKLHTGQIRLSGEPYIMHPLAVTKRLLSLNPDEDTIIAALLHDVLEDTDTKSEELIKRFGPIVTKLAQGVEKINKIHLQGKDRQIGSLRKMFLAMAEDLRVIFIKLADRLHNMETLGNMKREKQKRIAEETLNIYAPIAGRLGIYHFKEELENLGFRFAHPKEYKWISKELETMSKQRDKKIIQLKEKLTKDLQKTKIPFEIEGRVKHLYSVYKKLLSQKHQDLEKIYDIFALRIIVKSTGECYAILGEIHKHFTPLSHRFKDYVAVPKPNGYQSLHTTVIGLMGGRNPQPVEIQIRTEEMHKEAEYGIAAHWAYKEQTSSERTKWVQGLVDLENTLQDNIEFEEYLKRDTFGDRIFVLTPMGDIKDLPEGATPIDFAYTIHTDIGHHCTGAKVNGKIVPLDHPLENGDVVYLLTNKNSQPNQFWLNFVVTSHAKNRIKAWLRSQDTDKLIKAGKEILNKHLIRLGHNELDPHLLQLKNYEQKHLTLKEREQILEKIGNGSLSPIIVIKKLFPQDKLLKSDHASKKDKQSEIKSLKKTPSVIVSGDTIYKTKLASCCHPTEANRIVGYVTRGDYISIHKRSCKVIQKMRNQERLIPAHWSTEKEQIRVTLSIKAYDRIGLIRDVAHIFVIHKVNIISLIDENPDLIGTSTLKIVVEMENVEKLNHIISRLEGVEGIKSVQRILD